MAPTLPRDGHDFQIAIICALPLEADAVYAVLDIDWKDEGKHFRQAEGDENIYTTGVIGDHNVVLVHMPGIGKVNAAGVAVGIRSSFPNIQLALVVGICGGVPSGSGPGNEIFLGDVVISDSLVQYDLGRLYLGGLKRKNTVRDVLGRPSKRIQAIMAKLRSKTPREQLQDDAVFHLDAITRKMPEFKHPGLATNRIFDASYLHKHRSHESNVRCDQCQAGHDTVCQNALEMTCEDLGCDQSKLIRRCVDEDRASQDPSSFRVHVGTIGSGDLVIKSAQHRDLIAREEGVMAFEMEGAGIWDHFPSIVIKAVCDYADSHKNKKWQPFAAARAAACTKAFLKHIVPPRLAENPKEIPIPVTWYVPLSNTQRFVGRTKELEELQSKIFHPSTCSKVAVFGLGGIGKSRIAIELAYCTRLKRPEYSVLWVQATSLATLENSYLEIGKLMNIPSVDKEGADVKNLVKQYLSQKNAGKWLMIFDNADDEAIWLRDASRRTKTTTLADYVPQSHLGSILITTRNRRVAVHLAGHSVIELLEVSQEEAINILQASLVNTSILTKTNATSRLAEKLTYLPLAIVQAAAYMNMHDVSIEDYLKLLDSTEKDLINILSEDFNDEGRYPDAQNPVASTWLVSFEHMQNTNARAADLLAYLSCLSEKDIPLSLFPKELSGSSDKEMLECRGMLTGYSFVKKQISCNGGEILYQMHRLIRLVTRNWLENRGELQDWVQTATRVLVKRFPKQSHKNTVLCGLYLPHAQILYQSSTSSDVKEKYLLLRKIGRCLSHRGKYREAAEAYRYASEWFKINLGPSAKLTLIARDELALALGNDGKLQEAREVAEETVKLWSVVSGPRSSDVLASMGVLSMVYTTLGQFKIAEELSLEALEIQKELHGPRHELTLSYMDQLSWTYFRQWEKEQLQDVRDQMRDKAEKLATEVLRERRQTLGEHHPATSKSLGRLAPIYESYGKYDEALELRLKVVERRTEFYGKEHPSTLSSISNLAKTYGLLGRLTEAESLQLESLQVRMKTMDSDHPSAIREMDQIARIWSQQGRSDEARAMMRRCLMLSITKLGVDHPSTRRRIHAWGRRVGYEENDITSLQTDHGTDKALEKVDGLLAEWCQQSS